MSLDLRFPALASMAGKNGTSLETLASLARDHQDYLSVADACWFAKHQAVLWSHADATDYLATLVCRGTQV